MGRSGALIRFSSPSSSFLLVSVNFSAMSAVAGLAFGGLLVGSGVLITQGESYKGHALASGVTGVMTLAMGKRLLSTGKFMPAGMVATLGAAGLAYNVQKTLEWMLAEEGEF